MRGVVLGAEVSGFFDLVWAACWAVVFAPALPYFPMCVAEGVAWS